MTDKATAEFNAKAPPKSHDFFANTAETCCWLAPVALAVLPAALSYFDASGSYPVLGSYPVIDLPPVIRKHLPDLIVEGAFLAPILAIFNIAGFSGEAWEIGHEIDSTIYRFRMGLYNDRMNSSPSPP